uniref:Uncharacterized protein n=1 Tax=Sphaerodactylus townsendi TaxID=933632 RepID=A0ACB8G9N4_9SAUR
MVRRQFSSLYHSPNGFAKESYHYGEKALCEWAIAPYFLSIQGSVLPVSCCPHCTFTAYIPIELCMSSYGQNPHRALSQHTEKSYNFSSNILLTLSAHPQ